MGPDDLGAVIFTSTFANGPTVLVIEMDVLLDLISNHTLDFDNGFGYDHDEYLHSLLGPSPSANVGMAREYFTFPGPSCAAIQTHSSCEFRIRSTVSFSPSNLHR